MKTVRNLLIWSALGGLSGLGLGCVITTGSVNCDVCDSSPLCHNHIGADNTCYCDAGYAWEDPSDDGNLECDRIPPKAGGSNGCPDANSYQQGSQCYCDAGYAWCSNDENDLSCCEDDSQDAAEGTGGPGPGTGSDTAADGTDTSADGSTGGNPGVEPNPADCTPEFENAFFCGNTDPDDVEGSRLWICDGTNWNEDFGPADADCQFNGSDFAYGCFDDPTTQSVQFVCGDGPGTDCAGGENVCADSNVREFCFLGKLTNEDCFVSCTEVGIDGITFDFGECNAEGDAVCLCCDDPIDDACPAR